MTIPTGYLHPTDIASVPPDTVSTFVMTGGSSAQASDWFTSTGAAANAAAAGVGFVRATGYTTAGSALSFTANFQSTNAAGTPTSGTSISTGVGAAGGVSVLIGGSRSYQIRGDSSGYSFGSLVPGFIMLEQWKK